MLPEIVQAYPPQMAKLFSIGDGLLEIREIIVAMQSKIQAVPEIVNASGKINAGFEILFHLIFLRLYEYT